MNEINKPEIKYNQPVGMNKAVHQADYKASEKQAMDIKKDYREAAAAPGAEAAGRAQIMMSKTDNMEADIQKILNNPAILDRSEVYFRAAEKAGVPYPVAATFATQEVE
jgi:t-SNARE complex subunit (syntaxin)